MKYYTIEEVKDILANASSTSKVYVGTDSINSRKYTTFVTAVVLHIDGCKGCRIFPFVQREDRYPSKKFALITEVHKSIYIALELTESFPIERMEIHLDINENPRYASNAVLKEARSFVMGQNFKAVAKPNALAASSAGDYLARKEHLMINRK